MPVCWVLWALWAVAASAQPGGALYCGEHDVQVAEGRLQLARTWDPVFTDGFAQGLGPWQVDNYEGKLAISVADDGAGGSCVEVANHDATEDTAFEVASALGHPRAPPKDVRWVAMRGPLRGGTARPGAYGAGNSGSTLPMR